MASHIITQLAIKQLILKQCQITEEVAQVFVQALKSCNHSFCDIKRFETKFRRWNYCWMSDHDNWSDYKKAWKKSISDEINFLTSSNCFQEDRERYLYAFFGNVSMVDRLHTVSSQIGIQKLCTLHCSNSQKLYYGAIIAATEYDHHQQLMSKSSCCAPNMLYSLIREIPQCFMHFINHT